MELTTLRQFAAIARERHLTRAARALGVSQPALSAMLKKLEAELGTALVDRTGRGVELTPAGRAFLTHAEAALRAADDATRAVRELAGLERGSVRLGGGATAVTYLLPGVISAVRRAHPGVRFGVREAGSTDVARAVLAGDLDLGIVTLPIELPEADRLVRTPLVSDELRLITPPVSTNAPPPAPPAGSSPATPFRWAELRDRPVVGFEAGSAVRTLIDRAAAHAGVTLDYVMELRSIEGIKSMVLAGIGVGFVSRFALERDKPERNAERPSRDAPAPAGTAWNDPWGAGRPCADARLSRRLAILRRRDRTLSPAAAEVQRLLLAHAGGGQTSAGANSPASAHPGAGPGPARRER